MASYPDISDYTDSVQNADGHITDSVLKSAKPRLSQNGAPKMMSGGVAVVYPFQCGGDIYAVKCWLRDIGDLRDHYRRVEIFLESCRSEYFVAFSYVEKGIIAKNKAWPFLRMKWVGGKSLLEFINANVSSGPAMVLLAGRYLEMSQHLHNLGVAHGDLQGSNLMVEGSGNAINIKLIDYDTLIVPSSYGRKADAIALPSYQHPKRGKSSSYTGKEDYFSELVIYISLLAVSERPSIWKRYPKGSPSLKDEDRHDKDMIFVKEDFIADNPTEIFKELFGLSPQVNGLTLILWNFTRMPSIEQLLPIEQALRIVRDFIKHPPQPSRPSAFEELLKQSHCAENGWLNDSAFVTRPQNPPATSRKGSVNFPDTTQGDRFEDLLRPAGFNNSSNNTAPSETSGKSAPWSVVVILVFLVVGLLFAIVNKSNEANEVPPNITSVAPSSGIDERERISAQREAEALQSNTTKLAGRISELEQQLAAERIEANAKVATLLREKKTLESTGSDLLAQVDRLKRQLQDIAQKEPPPAAPPQSVLVAQNNGTLYRVAGLAFGDFLNVRSGAGASYSIVIRLKNGVEVSVAGAAVTNGTDVWLPCLIDTGLTQKQKGWVNSAFVEPVPPQ